MSFFVIFGQGLGKFKNFIIMVNRPSVEGGFEKKKKSKQKMIKGKLKIDSS